jgi:hypothetical protein
MNFGFHGFIDPNEKNETSWCVNSTCIIEGEDDYFGEDDHMAHHYATPLFYTELPKYQAVTSSRARPVAGPEHG